MREPEKASPNAGFDMMGPRREAAYLRSIVAKHFAGAAVAVGNISSTTQRFPDESNTTFEGELKSKVPPFRMTLGVGLPLEAYCAGE